MKDLGKIHLYTGEGKGKTTAAIGVAVRVLTRGGKVYCAHFIKGMEYGEDRLSEKYLNFHSDLLGKGCSVDHDPDQEDCRLAEEGWERVKNILARGEYDLIILDEINMAVYFQWLTEEQVLQGLREKAKDTEVILTGRYAPESFYDAADLVTEMVERKHYYKTQGLLSREGIDV